MTHRLATHLAEAPQGVRVVPDPSAQALRHADTIRRIAAKLDRLPLDQLESIERIVNQLLPEGSPK